jgi:hypothetical protein
MGELVSKICISFDLNFYAIGNLFGLGQDHSIVSVC